MSLRRPFSAPHGRRRRPPLRGTSVLLAAAGVLTGGLAQSASAATNAEVVTRASGVAGDAPATLFAFPGVVSADGQWSAYSADPTGVGVGFDGLNDPALYLYVRNIQTNQTYQLTNTGDAAATAIDAAGRYISYVQVKYHHTADGTEVSDGSSLSVVDTTNGAVTIVGRASGASGALATNATGLVTGDGKAVIFTADNVPGLGSGIFRRDLTTNVTTRLGDQPTIPHFPIPAPVALITSVSDDGSVIGIDDQYNTGGGILITPKGRAQTAGVPDVSPDGKTAAWTATVNGSAKLVIRSTASGADTTVAGPNVAQGNVTWISPDGNQIAVAPTLLSVFTGPNQAQLYTRSTGTYAAAGPYASELGFNHPNTFPLARNSAISRTGRFVLFSPGFDWSNLSPSREIAKSLAVGDNNGIGLPGGVDHPPATVYFEQAKAYCASETSAHVTINPSPAWLEPAKSVTGVASAGGKVLGQATYTTRTGVDIPVPAGIKTITYKITATFANGQTTTGTYDVPIRQNAGC